MQHQHCTIPYQTSRTCANPIPPLPKTTTEISGILQHCGHDSSLPPSITASHIRNSSSINPVLPPTSFFSFFLSFIHHSSLLSLPIIPTSHQGRQLRRQCNKSQSILEVEASQSLHGRPPPRPEPEQFTEKGSIGVFPSFVIIGASRGIETYGRVSQEGSGQEWEVCVGRD